MQRKLRLKQADAYDYRVATLYAAQAVVAYMEGNTDQAERIGNEYGDVDEWDDVVLHGVNGKTIHCQVKRQMTDFSDHDVNRGVKKKGDNAGNPLDRSALDSAFARLATYFAEPISVRGDKKRFRLAIPNAAIQIKDGLTIVQLRGVCVEWSKAGATVADFSKAGSPTDRVRAWLTTWCGFQSPEAMFECLRALEIFEHGEESRLDGDCSSCLNAWYSSPADVGKKVRDFLVLNASSDQLITPRMIAGDIDRYIHPHKRAWARYNMTSALEWQVSGTLSGHGTDIELPETVVERLWEPGDSRNYELQFAHPCASVKGNPLQGSLMRLALHVASGVAVSAKRVDGWQEVVAHTLRRTLGKTGVEQSDLRWNNWAEATAPTDQRRLVGRDSIEAEANRLAEKMNAVAWKMIKDEVDQEIGSAERTEVWKAVEEMWFRWKNEIDGSPPLQHEFAAEMLYARSEGDSGLGVLRSGPRTTTLIAEAVVMLLHLAIASDETNPSWSNFGAEISVRTVALLYWAGPAQQAEKVRRFFDHDKVTERAEFLGKETSRMLVLPQALLPTSTVYGKTLADGKGGGDSIADSRTPPSIVTRSPEYMEALEENTIASLKTFLAGVLQGREERRVQHVEALTTGGSHAD